MMNTDDMATINWWLSPENARSREELAQNRPELAEWLSKVEEAVEARMG
jgi:hypothetical protein